MGRGVQRSENKGFGGCILLGASNPEAQKPCAPRRDEEARRLRSWPLSGPCRGQIMHSLPNLCTVLARREHISPTVLPGQDSSSSITKQQASSGRQRCICQGVWPSSCTSLVNKRLGTDGWMASAQKVPKWVLAMIQVEQASEASPQCRICYGYLRTELESSIELRRQSPSGYITRRRRVDVVANCRRGMDTPG
jgi:hypothetical protein